jgi:hypothetical protein
MAGPSPGKQEFGLGKKGAALGFAMQDFGQFLVLDCFMFPLWFEMNQSVSKVNQNLDVLTWPYAANQYWLAQEKECKSNLSSIGFLS